MALLKFMKGNYSNLSNAAINEGQILICNDTAEMFVDVAADKRIKIGDFTVVESISALEALDATAVPTSRLYYVENGNILARSDGEKWIQVNKQPTAEELKTLLGLKSAAYADVGDFDVIGSAGAVREYVGEIPYGEDGQPISESVIGYINKKTDGIATSGNLEALAGRVTTAEGDIDALEKDLSDYKSEMIDALADKSDLAHTHQSADIGDLDETIKGYDYATKTEVGAAVDQALADAKAYVDEEDIFHTDITTVNALGGIEAGENLDGMTTHEILNTLLFPYVAFVLGSVSRNAAASTLENGETQTLNSASISITKKSKPITSVKLLNGSTVLGEKTGDEVAAGGTITFGNLGITVTKSNNPNLKFTVTDGQTSTDKNVGASTFVYPYYVGECAADATIDETLIEGLTKKVESKGNKTVTHSCENGRMIIAYPKAHGVLKSILDPNNFETIGDYTRSEVSVTGLDGTAQTYYVYASGAATVSSFKVQYKY